MLHLDGSYGEGGGQLLRTALALAVLRQQPVTISNIRAGRPKPGLRPQHLTAVMALARISGAEVEGAELESRRIVFRPRTLRGGDYLFDVAEKTGSAGAVTLVIQALLPAFVGGSLAADLLLRGGTHVPWSPPVHYLREVFFPALKEMGVRVSLDLHRWGWYPRGGGEVRLTVHGGGRLQGRTWDTPPPAGVFRGLSAVARLPRHILHRQAARLKERLGPELPVEEVEADSLDPGSFVFLWGPGAGFAALGAKGKPAEKVADEVADAFLQFQSSRMALDRHLADQLVVYMALAEGPSSFTTEALTQHLLTNIWVVEQFLGPLFTVEGNLGEPGRVTCRGRP